MPLKLKSSFPSLTKCLKLICPLHNAIQTLGVSGPDLKNLPVLLAKLEATYLKNDLVRCLITSIDRVNENCDVSLAWNGNKASQNVKLVSFATFYVL